jgi:cytochrome P450
LIAMTTSETAAPGRLPWDAADPYPYYEQCRRHGAVVWDDTAEAWLILGYHLARRILREPGWTSDPLANPSAPNAFRELDPQLLRRSLLLTDGSDHKRLRHSVSEVFTRSAINNFTEGVNAIATQAIDGFPAGADLDFMTDIAVPLPIAVMAAWLDLSVDAAQLLRDESPVISRMLGDVNDAAAVHAGIAALATLLTELLPLAAHRRSHPGDDLLSFIAADTDLELEDVVVTAAIIAVAGYETTSNLMGSAVVRLLSGPVGQRPLDAIDVIDDQLVTELLRLDAPVQAVQRTATRHHLIGNIAIKPSEPVLVVIAAANRDPTVFECPNELHINRSGLAPITFGYGTHHCLGATLARLETTAALTRLTARSPALIGAPSWRNSPAIRGPSTLPIAFTQ